MTKPHGKTRRLAEHIAAVAGPALADEITAGLTMPLAGAHTREKSAWVREVVARMDALLTEEQCREIMARRKCPSPKVGITRDQELWAQCEDLADFARAVRKRGWTGYLCERNTLRMRISPGRCHCTLSGTKEEPIGKTHCLCCAAHIRGGLEPTFGLPVDVDVESSVISGDPECWFVAYVGGRANADGPPVRPKVRGKPDRPKPIRTKVVPLPADLALPAQEARAAGIVHRALVTIATAASAETPSEQMVMKRVRPRMFGALWCLALHGRLCTEGHPHLCQRKRDGKNGVDVADASGVKEVTKYRVPGVCGQVEHLKRTYPQNWETTLTARGPRKGLVALRLLQRYARALCDAHGDPIAKGGHRYVGKAYQCFCHADMSVLVANAEGKPEATSGGRQGEHSGRGQEGRR